MQAGKGWYDYGSPGGRVPAPHPAAEALVAAHRKEEKEGGKAAFSTANIPARGEGAPDDKETEIFERTIFTLVNEGFKVIDDELVIVAGDPEFSRRP
jgi:hypothetical protein